MSRRGPWQAWRDTEHSGQGIRGRARRARAEEGAAPGNWPAARPPPAPLHYGRPSPAGPLAAARVPLAQLSDARGEAAGRPAPGTPARSLARGAAEPATATRLRTPPMSSFTAIVFGEIWMLGPGGGGGEWEGAGGSRREVLAAAPGSQLLRGAGRLEEKAPGAARLPPVRSAGTKAGGAPARGRGWGRGRRGAGLGRVRGVGDLERMEESSPADAGAGGGGEGGGRSAAGCLLARGSTAARPRGFWAAGGAARPRNLLSLPWSCLLTSWR
jgi:hypothetical protein